MSSEKRYFWLKLKEDFFRQKEIKKLRKIAGGDTYTIIYLKMLLKSLSSNGVLFFDGVENNFIEELALDIDESEENVAVTVRFLVSQGILVELNEEEYKLTTCESMVGSERANAERMRKLRNNRKLSQCDDVMSLSDSNVTNCDRRVRPSDTEIEKEIEIELDKELEKRERGMYQQIADMYNEICISFPRIRTLSDSRRKTIKARLNKYSVEDIREVFVRAEGSDFLKGANGRDWSADFDWLMKDSNIAKVLEGKYSNKKGESHEHIGANAKGYDASEYYGDMQSDFNGF